MKPRALVVDDDLEIANIVGEILTSLDHEYDIADSVAVARQLIETNQYDYFLVDLQLPVHSGHGLSRIQNGENLIDELIHQDESRKRRIIAITAHGNDRPIQPVEMMKKGIADYIPKPFEESGKTLDKAILEMLSQLDGSTKTTTLPDNSVPGLGDLTPFSGGTMEFFSDRVELCGVTICSGTRSKRHRKALDLLRIRLVQGFTAYSGDDFAEKLGLVRGQNGVSGLIRDIRNRIASALRKTAKIECLEEDVILSGGPGYRFSERLTVQDDRHSFDSHREGQDDKARRLDVPDLFSNVPSPHVPNVPDDGHATRRRTWILTRLQNELGVRARDVEFKFGCCRKTALRDLQALINEGLIDRKGTRRNCNYRLRGAGKAC